MKLQLVLNYNIQYTCWRLLPKASSKTYVFVTVIPHISISKRRVQWTFVIANMTPNKFFATSKTFQSHYPWPWQFLQYTLVYQIRMHITNTFYELHIISIKKWKKQVHANTPSTQACQHVSTQARQASQQANTPSKPAAKHAKHESTQASQARDLADSSFPY